MKISQLSLVATAFIVLAMFIKPTFAIVPIVQNVVPYSAGGSTWINVTIFHQPEDAVLPHYVNIIEVTMGANTTDMTIGVQPLTPPDFLNFTVSYDLGPVSGTPTITVKAHCIFNGWSQPPDYTTTVPEFSPFAFLLVLALATFLVIFGSRKIELKKSGQNPQCTTNQRKNS